MWLLRWGLGGEPGSRRRRIPRDAGASGLLRRVPLPGWAAKPPSRHVRWTVSIDAQVGGRVKSEADRVHSDW